MITSTVTSLHRIFPDIRPTWDSVPTSSSAAWSSLQSSFSISSCSSVPRSGRLKRPPLQHLPLLRINFDPVTPNRPRRTDPPAGSRIQELMSQPIPSNNDPTPERRESDSSFLPVVVAFVVAILVVLVGAIIFIKTRQTKAIPNPKESHPTSERMPASPPFEPVDRILLT
jgi:hypothetical protein